ncbi:MAG: hypothetical protein AAGI44_08230 [Pseudomonadota bacterium]
MKTQLISFCAAVSFALLFATNASAYFVRPVVSFGPGTIIDGLIVDGSTQNAVGFSDAARSARSDVNLETGEVKLFASASGPGTSASANGIMGDTLTFLNGAGTSASFSFGLEATLDIDVSMETLDSPGFFATVTMGVFNQGVADFTNWFSLGTDALFFGTDSFSLTDPQTDVLDQLVEIGVFGNVPLASGRETLDVFYAAFIAGGSGSFGQITSFMFDGENTAIAGLDAGEGVDVFSDSGVFLGFGREPSSQVPAPMSALLLAIGLLVMRFTRISTSS